ncbi:hypothetical protein G7062_10645 [Erysipelothrix sp. HDW6C]|uniref:hypothetical protein n=1 Tax=Erysipelothrix sp. HDW6C TaxID=2714930 RepID=UPI00140B24C3|nr:hypothetical protein [Erysipelothrix sp. HDW6C]QIK70727.1 hypothetical protein G7062_10645 [Erysipelothrix sp. HDW6C]
MLKKITASLILIALAVTVLSVSADDSYQESNNNDTNKNKEIIHTTEVTTGEGENQENDEIEIENDEDINEDSDPIEMDSDALAENPNDPTATPEDSSSDTTIEEDVLQVAPFELSSNEVIVTTFSELKSLIESSGNGNYTTYYLGADIDGLSGGIVIPSGYSFTIDGTNPLTGIRHTYNEFNSSTTGNTIRHSTSAPVTFTLRNMDIKGQNNHGTIYITGGTANTVLIYDNISYHGPRITENANGRAIYRNSDVIIGEGSFGSVSREVGDVKHVQFEGNVSIRHTDNTYETFTMGNNNSFTFKENSNVTVSSKRGMSNRSVSTTIVFEENSILNMTQPSTQGTSAVFYLEGSASSFTMRPGSELNVDRPFATSNIESILYAARAADADIDGGKITYKHNGSQASYALFSLRSLTLRNGAHIDLNIDLFSQVTLIDLATTFKMTDSTITTNVGDTIGRAITAPMITSITTQPIEISNSVVDIRANVINTPIFQGNEAKIDNSDVSFAAKQTMGANPFRVPTFNRLQSSTYTLKFGTYTPTGPLVLGSSGANQPFTLTDSTINIEGDTIKNSILFGSTITADSLSKSVINITSAKDISASLFTSANINTMHNVEINVTAIGNVSPVHFLTASTGMMSLNNIDLSVKAGAWNSRLYSGPSLEINESSIDVQFSGDMVAPFIETNDFKGLTKSSLKVATDGSYNNKLAFIYNKGATTTSFIDSLFDTKFDQTYASTITARKLILNNTTARHIARKTNLDIAPRLLYNVIEFEAHNNSDITMHYAEEGGNLVSHVDTTSFILENSKLDIKADTQNIPMVGAVGTVSFSNASVSLSTPNSNAANATLLKAREINTTDSVVTIDSGNSTLDSLIELTGTVFSFKKTSENSDAHLLLIGNNVSKLIRTGNTAVDMTLQGHQMNQWDVFGNKENFDGFTHKSRARFERDDEALGTLSFKYLGNKVSNESFTFTVNDFAGDGWDNPVDTLSFDGSKTKIFSIGTPEPVTANAEAGGETITGIFVPYGQVRVTYLSNGILKSTIARADAQGNFIANTDPLDSAEIQLETFGNFIYNFAETGSLRFGVMPSTLNFGINAIPNKPTVFNRHGSDTELEIIDNRSKGAGWKLEVQVITPLEATNGDYSNADGIIVYRDGNAIDHELKLNQRFQIAQSDANTPAIHKIQWANDEGILLKFMDGSSIHKDAQYSVKIQWILTDTK